VLGGITAGGGAVAERGPDGDVEGGREVTTLRLKAPFPYFGGKSRISARVWDALGSPDNVIEPFFGSGAVLLSRPAPWSGVETVNDRDHFISNFWRAIKGDPESVAAHADGPVIECVPAGTMIATPWGDVPVECVRPGMIVWGEDGKGRIIPTTVTATRRSETEGPLSSVGPLRLTGNHPVWTAERGYVNATDLASGIHVGTICNYDTTGRMRDVSDAVPCAGEGRAVLLDGLHGPGQPQPREALRRVREDVPRPAWESRPTLLLRELRPAFGVEDESRIDADERHGGAGGAFRERGRTAAAPGVAGVAGQPDPQPGRDAAGDNQRGTDPVGQPFVRATIDASSANATGASRRTVDGGGDGQDRAGTHGPATVLVQVGYRATRPDAGRRGGWRFTPEREGDGSGQAAGRDTHGTRLDGAAIHEPSRPHQPGCGGGGDRVCVTVYNFQTDSANYFADGVLVHNCDLHARHRWLVLSDDATRWRERMKADPDHFDAKVAGWWCWGLCCWIGSGWCAGGTEWDQRMVLDAGRGVHPAHLASKLRINGTSKRLGMGVHSKGQSQQIPDMAPGKGVDALAGVLREGRPQLADAYDVGRGVNSEGALGTCEARRAWLTDWFARLADRLRLVRVCCGDWSRVCSSPSTTTRLGVTGVFLDPPYPITQKGRGKKKSRDGSLYASDAAGGTEALRDEVLAWCRVAGADRKLMRIVVAGYENDGYEALVRDHGWREEAWKAQGGYGNRTDGGKANAARERLWLSPGCRAEETLFTGQTEEGMK